MLSSCKFGDLNTVKEIFKSGNDKDIYEKTNHGSNGFMKACIYGHLNIVKYLVEINYNIHEKDNDGMNGFMGACVFGHLNIVKYLVEMNYNIHEKDNNSKNGLIHALERKNYDIVICLLEHGIEMIERHKGLCKEIENRMNEIQTFYNAIEKNLNAIDIRIVHEIKSFTYGLENLKKLF
jgi:ankyrin repeat protein